jgi:hypothetical protein
MSLLSPEASGGDIATEGFTFQEAVLLAKLPSFLAEDGFIAIIREALCDFEASFFAFPSGVRREGFEAKDYSLTPGQFWEEVGTFERIDAGDPAAYGGFTLVSTGLSDKVDPVTNGLRRVRDPYPFYPPGSGLLGASYAEYEQRVLGHGQSASAARLLFEKVRVEPNWSTARLDAEALFTRSMHEHHPWSMECRGADLRQCYLKLKALVQSRKNRLIARHELEGILAAELSAHVPARPLRLHTLTSPSEHISSGAIVANWEDFFGGKGRNYPPPEKWSADLLRPLEEFRQWVISEKRPRRIRLSGNRRLSTSVAIGWVLSAVSGFSIEMEFRDSTWATDAHANGNTPNYIIGSQFTAGSGDRLVVSIGIIREVGGDVSRYLERVGLGGLPRLDLSGKEPIVSAEQLNLVVRSIKDEIGAAIRECSAKSIDLFMAGPAPLALLLGHRMNALATTRCYEWIQEGQYEPTCILQCS